MLRHRVWMLPLTGLLLAGAHAQTTLDDGTFRLLFDGREIGSERFWIKQTGQGAEAVIIAHATITIDTAGRREEVTTDLQTSRGSLRPEAYARQTLSGDTLDAAVAGNRVRVRVRSARGETVREFLLGDRGHLLDDFVAHQYYFLARTATGTQRARVLAPALAWQATATVTTTGANPLTIGGETISATRIAVTPENGQERVVWVDDHGRVLRLEVPGRRFVAERAAPPR